MKPFNASECFEHVISELSDFDSDYKQLVEAAKQGQEVFNDSLRKLKVQKPHIAEQTKLIEEMEASFFNKKFDSQEVLRSR